MMECFLLKKHLGQTSLAVTRLGDDFACDTAFFIANIWAKQVWPLRDLAMILLAIRRFLLLTFGPNKFGRYEAWQLFCF
ncbi:MAG: hypothetical protein RMJ33_07915 [Saprospiraceae bacterium]|nr:hypothetical protein [Saprospiraceae bacterium]